MNRLTSRGSRTAKTTAILAILFLFSTIIFLPEASAVVNNAFTCATVPPTGVTDFTCTTGNSATISSSGPNLGHSLQFTGNLPAQYTNITFDVIANTAGSPPSIWNMVFCQELSGGAPCAASCSTSNGAVSCGTSLIYTDAGVSHNLRLQLNWATKTYDVYLDGSGTATATGIAFVSSASRYVKSTSLSRPLGNPALGQFNNLAMSGPDGSDFTAPSQSTSIGSPIPAGRNAINFDLTYGYDPQVFLKESSSSGVYIHKMTRDLALVTSAQPCLQFAGATGPNTNSWLAWTTEERLLTLCQASTTTGQPYALATLTPNFEPLSFQTVSASGAANEGPTSRLDAADLENIAYDAPSIQSGYAYDYDSNTREGSTGPTTAVRDVFVDKFTGTKWISSNAAGASLKAFDAGSGTNSLNFNAIDVKYVWAKSNSVWFTGNTGVPGQTLYHYTRSGGVLSSVASFTDGCAITAFTITHDEKYSITACGTAITIRDAVTGAIIKFLSAPTQIDQLQADIANNYLYGLTAGIDGLMRKWDIFAHTTSTGGDGGAGQPNPPPAVGTVPTSAPDYSTAPTSTLTGPAQNTGNPLGNMVSFLNAAWGFDWSWILGAIFMALCLVPILKKTNGSPLAGGVIILLVTGANVELGLWGEYTFIAMVFLIIAIAANRIFSKGKADDGEDSA